MFCFTCPDVYQMVAMRLLLFFLFFIVIGQCLRKIAQNYVSPNHRPLVLDLVVTFSLYGQTMGCNYVHRVFGPVWYLMATAAVGVCHALLLSPGVTANPVTRVVTCIACDVPMEKLVMRVGVQLAGGLACHPIATLLWQTLMADHSGRDLGQMHCMVNHWVRGQSVPVVTVLGMELLGTLGVNAMAMKVSQLSTDAYEMTVKVFIGCLLHAAGAKLPAVYLNPVLANVQLFRCSNREILEHVMVYWIGPSVGACVAVFMYFSFRSQQTQRTPCRPSVTFDKCSSDEISQPSHPCVELDELLSPEISQPCRPCATLDEFPSLETSRPRSLSRNRKRKCGVCDSKSRSNSSRPGRCSCAFEVNEESDMECCEDVEPSACRPSGCGITAQVRQAAVNGSKQLNYLFDIPPTVCRKGLRLRHNILVTKKSKCQPTDILKDLTASDWKSSCCPTPTFRDTASPGFLPSDNWRKFCSSSSGKRNRSRSPGMKLEWTDDERSSKRRCSRTRSSSRGPTRVSSRPSKQDHERRSARSSSRSRRSVASRRSSPRTSDSRESPRKKQHSRQSSGSRTSYATQDYRSTTPKASGHSQVRENYSTAEKSSKKSVAKAKSQVKPSKMSTANVSYHKKSSGPTNRPVGDFSHYSDYDRKFKAVKKSATG